MGDIEDRVRVAKGVAGSADKLGEMAGVSDSTVYQFLRDSSRVSPESYRKIVRAAERIESGKPGLRAVTTRTRRPVEPRQEPVAHVPDPEVARVVIDQIRREHASPTTMEMLLRVALDLAEKDRLLRMYEELEKYR